MKGSYIIVLELDRNRDILIGKNLNISFKKGIYVYVGSALNGLEQRIKRHLRKNKKKHWHIDYLLDYANIVEIFYKENNLKEECKIADFLKENFSYIPGFGCTDCKCNRHLFYGFKKDFDRSLQSLKMNKYLFNANT